MPHLLLELFEPEATHVAGVKVEQIDRVLSAEVGQVSLESSKAVAGRPGRRAEKSLFAFDGRGWL